VILWKTANGARPLGTTTHEINYYRNIERQLRMGKSLDEMTDAELISAITELQSVRVPSSKPKSPKRLDERKPKSPPKPGDWRRGFFDEDELP
jgi:hypothetical protein